MGFLDVLGAATTPAAQYRAGQLQGEEQKQERGQNDFLKALALAQKQQQDALAQEAQRAQIRNLNSEVYTREHPQETFGAPFAATQGGKRVLVERGNRGTNRVLEGLEPPDKNIDPNSPEGIAAAGKKAENAAKAAATFGVVQVEDPEHPTEKRYVQRIEAPGKQAPSTRAGGLMGGMAARAGAQAAGALNAMEHASGVMKGMEADIASGKIPLTGIDEFVNKIAGTEDPNRPGVHPIDKAAQTLALVGLAKVNPALARYLRLGIQFGVDESAFTNRTSDFRTKLMDFLSRVHAGFSPEMIQDVGDYRENLTKGYRSYFPADQTGGAPRTSAGTANASLYDKAFEALGPDATDAQIKAWVQQHSKP